MKVTCPQCNSSLDCPDDYAGKRGKCPRCDAKFIIQPPRSSSTTASFCATPPNASSPPPPHPESAPGTAEIIDDENVLYRDAFVTVKLDGSADFRIKSTAEAKLVIKALQLVKRQLRVQLNEINSQLREVQHQYTDNVRRRGSMIRGGGKIGQIIRVFQTVFRDSTRHQLAEHVQPLHNQKQYIDGLLNSLEHHIVQIQAGILRA